MLPVLIALRQDLGIVRLAASSPASIVITHAGFTSFSRIWCEHSLGYFEQILSMHGAAPDLVLESQCQCAGDASCTFVLAWSAAEAQRPFEVSAELRA